MKDRDAELSRLTIELTNDFARWDHLFKNGGQDPFWPDGMNLGLVRNHVLSDKRRIEELVEADQEELSLFGVSYPDIYYRETPPEVPKDYMAKADEIRQRAHEQMALYEQDPNFLYILENHPKVFPKGETKATKEAGLSIWKTCGLRKYRMTIESGNLVDMRRDFHEDYEKKAARWAEGAAGLRRFLELEHNPEDDVVIVEEEDQEPTEEYLDEEPDEELPEEVPTPAPSRKPSLEAQISGAKVKSEAQHKQDREQDREQEEQLALF